MALRVFLALQFLYCLIACTSASATVSQSEADAIVKKAQDEADDLIQKANVLLWHASFIESAAMDANANHTLREKRALSAAQTSAAGITTARLFLTEAENAVKEAEEEAAFALSKSDKLLQNGRDTQERALRTQNSAFTIGRIAGTGEGANKDFSARKAAAQTVRDNIKKHESEFNAIQEIINIINASVIKAKVAVNKSELALEKVNIAVSADKAENSLDIVKSSTNMAEKKNNDAKTHLQKIKQLIANNSDLAMEAVKEQEEVAEKAVALSIKQLEKAIHASNTAKEETTKIKKLFETVHLLLALDEAKQKAEEADTAAKNVEEQEKEMQSAIKEINTQLESIERTYYTAAAMISLEKTKILVNESQKQVNKITENKKKVNKIAVVIQKSKKHFSEEVVKKLDEKEKNAASNLKKIIQLLNDANTSMLELNKHEKEAQAALGSISRITDLTALSEQYKKVDMAATKAGRESIRIGEILQKTNEETEMATRTHTDVIQILKSAKNPVSNEAINTSDTQKGLSGNESGNNEAYLSDTYTFDDVSNEKVKLAISDSSTVHSLCVCVLLVLQFLLI